MYGDQFGEFVWSKCYRNVLRFVAFSVYETYSVHPRRLRKKKHFLVIFVNFIPETIKGQIMRCPI